MVRELNFVIILTINFISKSRVQNKNFSKTYVYKNISGELILLTFLIFVEMHSFFFLRRRIQSKYLNKLIVLNK